MKTYKALLFSLMLIPTQLMGHDWYPQTCCSDQDCFPMTADEVLPVTEGYLIVETGEVIPYDRVRVTPVEGGVLYHRCSLGGDRSRFTLGRSRQEGYCFWAPPLGY